MVILAFAADDTTSLEIIKYRLGIPSDEAVEYSTKRTDETIEVDRLDIVLDPAEQTRMRWEIEQLMPPEQLAELNDEVDMAAYNEYNNWQLENEMGFNSQPVSLQEIASLRKLLVRVVQQLTEQL